MLSSGASRSYHWCHSVSLRETLSQSSLKVPFEVSATAFSHTASGIQSLGFFRTELMSSAPPPLRKMSTSFAAILPAETLTLLVSIRAKIILWRSNRPRWMYR